MSSRVKYFYKGKDTDLMVFAKSANSVKDYLEHPSIEKLSDTVEVFQVFTNRDSRGSSGTLDEASHAQMDNEFGEGKNMNQVIDLILRNGQPKFTHDSI